MNAQVDAIIQLALNEDIGTGDLSAEHVIPAGARAQGVMIAKAEGVLSGLSVVERVFELVDQQILWTVEASDGDATTARMTTGYPTLIGHLDGPARSILTAERIALNFVQRLSGVATLTRSYVEAVRGTHARIVDTRKTTPGMRILEKAAVRHGGGSNHRIGLFDGVMIKDNHIVAVGGDPGIRAAVERARWAVPHTIKIEVEVSNLDQLELAIEAGADIIMLDNMDIKAMRKAVELTERRAVLEASGGVTLESVRAIAETGVDLISVGALTHSAPALDISLDLTVA
jgi:nicotinate-nucleotide pyrophosphorylase (carboxylating)